MLEVYDILHQVCVESILKIQGLGLSFTVQHRVLRASKLARWA